VVNSVSLIAIPPTGDGGSNWDTNCGPACNNTKHPDPFFQIKKGSTVLFTSSSKTNIKPGNLPTGWDIANRNFEFGVDDVIRIIVRDDDGGAIPSNADYMGEARFTFNQHKLSNPIIVSNGQTRIQLNVTWK
jgi:hypothetical protein